MIFPFTIHNATALFRPYIDGHRDHLCEKYEKYGHRVFTGNAERDSKPRWSYYDVDAEVVSETCVIFTTYGMANFASGGRGAKQEVITYDCAPKVLAAVVEQRKQQLAAEEYVRRCRAQLAAIEAAGISAIYKELFTPPCDHTWRADRGGPNDDEVVRCSQCGDYQK